jgi:hypothetical protein
MDPRVKTPLADLQAQFRVSKQLYDAMLESSAAIDQINALQKQIQERSTSGGATDALQEYGKKLEALAGRTGFGRGGGGGGGRGGETGAPPTFSALRGQLDRLLHELQSADVAPTKQQTAASAARMQSFTALKAQWAALKGQGLTAVNSQLKAANLPELTLQ